MEKNTKKQRPRKVVSTAGEFKSNASIYGAALARQVAAELGPRRPASASPKKKVRG